MGRLFARASSEYLTISGNPAALKLRNNFYGEFHAIFQSLPTSSQIFPLVAKDGGAGNRSWGVYIEHDGANILLRMSTSTDGSTVNNNPTYTWNPTAGTKYAIGFSVDQGNPVGKTTIKLYVDGSQVASTDPAGDGALFDTTANVTVATTGATSNFADVIIDKVVLFKDPANSVRVPGTDRFVRFYAGGSGVDTVVGNWPLFMGQLRDISSNGNNLTIGGGTPESVIGNTNVVPYVAGGPVSG